MTPTPERPDFAAAIDLLEGAARGLLMCGKRPLEERKKQATEMMDGVFALRAYPALVEECEQLRAESNGKNWQGIARIAALETENAALEAELDAASKELDITRESLSVARAEVERLRKTYAAEHHSFHQAEAELDAARPLIEAAMGYKPEPFGHGRERLHEAAIDYADAYRERRDREQKEKT